MRNSHTPCDQPSPTNSAGISAQLSAAPDAGRASDLREAQRAFGAPRYRALYRAWQRDGDRVLDATTSPTLADAWLAERAPGVPRAGPSVPSSLPLVGTA